MTTKLRTGRDRRALLGSALIALAASACGFPDYAVSSTSALPAEGGEAGPGGMATGAGGASAVGGFVTAGVGSGGDTHGGNGGSTQSPAQGGGSGEGGSAASSAMGGTHNDVGEAGGEAGAGGAPSPSPSKSCADYHALPADCACRDDVGHAYLFCSTTRSWSQAAVRCGFYEMALAKIESPAEDAWVLKQAKALSDPRPLTFFWVGASSLDSPGTWHWPDGSVFWIGDWRGSAVDDSYSNWRISSPKNTASFACSFADTNGWEDGDCAIPRGYVCESP